MTLNRVPLAIALGFTGGALGGCLAPPSPALLRTPVRWIVVEKPAGEIPWGDRVGDGRIDPDAVVLTMQPLGPGARDPHDSFVEVLEISPQPPASPGETVTATVRVAGAARGEVYRLVATASRPDVRLIGAREAVVHGGESASFRFTSLSTGPGGIAVGVERLGSPEGRRP